MTDAYVLAPSGEKSIYLYFVATNASPEPDVLISVTSPASDMVMIYSRVQQVGPGIMGITRAGLSIPANGRSEFRPNGLEWMLMDPYGPHAVGDRVPVTLHFQRGDVRIVAPVVAAPPVAKSAPPAP